ncbi:hypothetical protein P43SY_003302 [Pythium insidiosum]|uniref:Uncharacterized protein n=1 Tax=Pythium insidiosum TaxID=114742 RepID=A0AAD5LY74_PYTIN|nr:hypothetical protein P43SY_003302 [Pythium insidiosum]
METPPSSSAAAGAVLIVRLRPASMALAWTLMLLARSICIAFLVGMAGLLRLLDHPFMVYYAELLRPGIKPLLTPAASLYALLAVAHGYQVAMMFIHSARARQLVMHSCKVSRATIAPGDERVASQALHATRSLWSKLFSRTGFFGVESAYFEGRYIARELVEIGSQSVQAYTSSYLISKRWVNNLYVLFVVLNCWSTPLIQRFTVHTPALDRLLCLVIDTVLDSGTALLLPLILFVPYARAFSPTFYSFDINVLYDDVWFVNLIMENRQIVPLSVWDLLLKIVPHLSIYFSLGSIRAIVRPERSATFSRMRRVALPTDPAGPSLGLLPSGPAAAAVAPAPTPTSTPAHRLKHSKTAAQRVRATLQRRFHGRWALMLHFVFVVWGAGVLLAHVVAISRQHANTHGEISGCKQQVRPWFVAETACLIYEFHCYRRGLTSMDGDALSALRHDSLTALIVAHCPQLTVSPAIRRFPNLFGMEIYNSTLVRWGREAAISPATHQWLNYVLLIRTNLSAIPEGMTLDAPPTLIDIELSVTNLTTLPPTLDVAWAPLLTLYVEHSRFTAVPPPILRMHLDDLSLIGNEIEELPPFSAVQGKSFMLALAHNPIRSLPRGDGPLPTVAYLNLAHTRIEELPDWLVAYAETTSEQVYLFGTPFCDALSDEEKAQRYGETAKLSCLYRNLRMDGRYPLAMNTKRRKL